MNLAGRIDAIVIGASAGGIEALSALLPALPAGARASIFVVIHLPRDRPSVLASIFARKCALPVHEAEDKEPVLPGTVYVAPTNYHLLAGRPERAADIAVCRRPRCIILGDPPLTCCSSLRPIFIANACWE